MCRGEARQVDGIHRQTVDNSGEDAPFGTVTAQRTAGSCLEVPSNGSVEKIIVDNERNPTDTQRRQGDDAQVLHVS